MPFLNDESSAPTDDVQYTIRAINKSTNSGRFAIFQKDPGIGVPNVFPLAWFAKQVSPDTTVKFNWSITYNCVWAENGELAPGVTFDASQTFGCDLSTTNQITLTHKTGNYNFVDQRKGSKDGTIYIQQDGSIPLKKASVGIGMSGFGTFVVQAQPNINLTFTPHPQYFIVFGDFVQGDVLDVGQLTNIAEIEFKPNTYSMTALLNEDNSWTVTSTSSVNAALLAARETDPSVSLYTLSLPSITSEESGGGLTDLQVTYVDQIIFSKCSGSKKGKEITVESVTPPKQELNDEAIYTIVGKSGSTGFGPVSAKYMKKQGNSYIFLQQ